VVRGFHPANALLHEVPALEVLEWVDAPILALAIDGTIPFANWAFADMVGLTPEMVTSLTYLLVFENLPECASPIASLRTQERKTVELTHLDGSTVMAKMSECLLLGDAEVALATFDDITEEHWFQ
jgi:PAS domain S-box-containing protein